MAEKKDLNSENETILEDYNIDNDTSETDDKPSFFKTQLNNLKNFVYGSPKRKTGQYIVGLGSTSYPWDKCKDHNEVSEFISSLHEKLYSKIFRKEIELEAEDKEKLFYKYAPLVYNGTRLFIFNAFTVDIALAVGSSAHIAIKIYKKGKEPAKQNTELESEEDINNA